MAFDIRLPNINGNTEAEQLYQIKRYLYQLAEELKYNLNTLEAGTSDETSLERVGIIDSLNKWKLEIDGVQTSIATIRQTVSSHGANIVSLTRWKSDVEQDISVIASIEQDVSDQGARITSLTEWRSGVEDDISSIASIEQRVSDAETTIKLLTELNDGDASSLAEIVNRVSATEAGISGLTTWKDSVVNSIAKIDQISAQDYASITGLAQHKTDTSNSIARVEGKADANTSAIGLVSEWKEAVKGDVSSIASIKTLAESNQSQVNILATWKSGVESDVSSIASIKALAQANESAVKTLAEWKDGVNGDISSIASIDAMAKANQASIGLVVNNGVVKGSILIDAINDESVAKISADRLDIEGKTLNIKVDATNINGGLTIGQLPSTVAQKGDIPSKISALTNDAGFTNADGVVSIIDGRVTADYVEALAIKVSAAQVTGALTIGQLPSNVATSEDIPHNVSDLNNDTGYQTSNDVNSIVDGKGYQTATDVNGIVEGKGYQTRTGVVSIIDGRITADFIKTLGLEVGNQIKMGANATISWDSIDSKPHNLATTTDVTNAKNSAINTASADATTKANAAQANAISAASSDATTKANSAKEGAVNEIKGLGYQTSSQVKTEISESKIRTDQIEVTDLNAFGATIGGFTIDNNSLHTQMGSTSNRILLCSGTSARYTVGDFTSTGWSILAGSNFGVLKNGTAYMRNANIEGVITSNEGKIGGWNIDSKGLYHGNSAAEDADLFLFPQGYEYSYKIAGVNLDNLCVKIKNNFGIDPNGNMYCAEGYFGYSTKAETRLVRITQGKIQIKSTSDTSGNYTRYPLLEFYDGNTLCTLVARKIGSTWDLAVIADKNSDDFITTV